jgi:hypothetical protein
MCLKVFWKCLNLACIRQLENCLCTQNASFLNVSCKINPKNLESRLFCPHSCLSKCLSLSLSIPGVMVPTDSNSKKAGSCPHYRRPYGCSGKMPQSAIGVLALGKMPQSAIGVLALGKMPQSAIGVLVLLGNNGHTCTMRKSAVFFSNLVLQHVDKLISSLFILHLFIFILDVRCMGNVFRIYQPRNAHVWNLGILLSNAMAERSMGSTWQQILN